MKKTYLRKRVRFLLLFISILVFPVTIYYFSPAVSMMGSIRGIITGSIIVFASQFVSAFIFGRFFCGWICPAGACQEFAFKINDRTVSVKKIRWIKYVIWVPWLSGIIFFIIKAQGNLSIDFIWGTANGISVTDLSSYIVYFTVLFIFLGLSIFVGRRAGCHTICWMAPFMIFGRKIGNLLHLPGLRLKADTAQCEQCEKCTNSCPMSLPVMEMVSQAKMENSECILCGNCTTVCSRRVIRFSFSCPDYRKDDSGSV